MREKLRDKGRLEHILEAIDDTIEITENVSFDDFMSNKVLRFAVVKTVEIIGEASYKLTKEFKENHPEVSWAKIVGLRHVLVHGYYQISEVRLWEIVQKDLLPLREQIQTLYNNNNF